MNHHLNIFTFFNGRDAQYLEDNLSRAFALCLLHDPVFLDRVLGQVLDAEDYTTLSKERWEDRTVGVDVQRMANTFEGCRKLFAVASSPLELDAGVIAALSPGGTDRPKIDVAIELGEIYVIFEFKRVKADCSAQLRGQAEAIRLINQPEEVTIRYKDFSWGKIIAVAESAQGFLKQLGAGSVFTCDFVDLLESRYADWFPLRALGRIAAPKSLQSPEVERINKRLDLIKEKLGETSDFEYQIYTGTYKRSTLNVDWGWTREVLLDYDYRSGKSWIRLSIYAGDTKRQGWSLFGLKVPFEQLTSPVSGAELSVSPFLKFRHFNSAIADLFLDWEVARHTHTLEFHTANAGRYPRERWPEFEAKLDALYPEWRSDCAYEAKLTESNRSYFDFSAGVLFELRIPYGEAQRHDPDKLSIAVTYFRECIEALRGEIEHKNTNHE